MAFLPNLPPEILDLILRDSHLAVTLWQCGNHGLNHRLSSGITELSLHYFPYKQFAIPKMVLELPKLKSLELYASEELLSEPKAWIGIREQLPRTLESLTIDSIDSDQIFLDFDTVDREAYKHGPIRNHGYISIESILPKLQNLEFKRSKLPLERSLLLSLPPSLSSLTIDNGNFTLPFMSLLPPNIQYLGLIARLSNANVNEVQPTLDDLVNLPPNLVIERMQTHLTSEQMSRVQFPHGLRTVTLWLIESCPPSLIAQLPRTLTRLEIAASIDWPSSLDLKRSGGDQLLLHASWPPCLQSLTIELKECERATLVRIARHLKSLHLTLRTGTFFADELPPCLEELHLYADPLHTQCEGTFPTSLTRMRCSKMLAMQWCAPITTLIELSIFELTFDFVPLDAYPQLCSNIITLELMGLHIGSLGQLPRSLTCLTLRTLLVPGTPTVPIQVEFTDLPSGLIRLMITTITNGLLTRTGRQPVYIGHFPNGSLPLLTHLRLPKHLKLHAESIKRLPHSLKSLETSIQGWTGVPPSHLASLPPNLVSTKLDDSSYQHEDLGDHWPPTAWRGLVGTPGAHHIPKLLDRLHHVQ